MKLTTAVTCILLCAAGNAQTKPQGAASAGIERIASYGVIWRHTCAEVVGAALTMPGAQQVDNPTEITVSIAGRDWRFKNPTEYTFIVSIAGKDTLVELDPIPSEPKHSDSCGMNFLWGTNEEKDMFRGVALLRAKKKDLLAWADSLPLTRMDKSDEQESEFQKTSMMELKRIAAQAGY